MPILRLNADADGLTVQGASAPALGTLRSAARGQGPVIVLIHGYKYDPVCRRCSPHATIFSRAAQSRKPTHQSWLAPLGFGTGAADEGLALAFGWRARGNIWQAARSARCAGRWLARAIQEIRAHAPHRDVHAITHSMGSEVILAALDHLGPGDLTRIVTLTGATYAGRAREALSTQAGRTVELINITSRENAVFDLCFEHLVRSQIPSDRAMGRGLDLPNAVTLRLDCPHTLAALPALGGQIAAPKRLVCHWSSYTRPGALAFYAHALRHHRAVPLASLRINASEPTARPWSRMCVATRPLPLLPLRQNRAS